ncbi:MAG: hypothetical protein PVI56_09105 [Gammaproteobacteria bacterium]|jgi:hypothetical protein
MLDIEKNQVIHYGDGQSVTVYGDLSDPNMYYIVPLPVIPRSNGVPEFALVEYKKNAGISGTCSFMVELQHDAAAEAAVKAKLGNGITLGQLSWQSAKVWFTYMVKGQTFNLVASPAMYGANRASFVINLPDADTLNAFKDAFGPDGSAGGTFQFQYDLTCYAKLPPATVTVEFNSDIAYKYQKTVQVSRNVWGHVTHRAVEIHQYLTESQAGTVTVDPGARPLSPQTSKQLTDWANQTLEDDVNRAVNNALRVIGENNANDFSMSQVASFTNVYRMGQVVEWHISPLAPIPAFSADDWGKVYSVVDDRTFVLSVTVQGFDDSQVESVDVTVDYPTRSTGNTQHFTADSAGSWIFKAPGNAASGSYDPTYEYSYVVHFKDGSDPYQSPKIQGTETEIYLALRDLSVLSVEFDASNVPFSDAADDRSDFVAAFSDDAGSDNKVKQVQVEFYFVNEANGAVKHQEFNLTAAAPRQVVSSLRELPSTNPYQYRVTYLLESGREVFTDWVSNNANRVMLQPPFVTQTVQIIPLQDFKLLELQVAFKDPINNFNQKKQWVIQNTGEKPLPSWTFLAPMNSTDIRLAYDGRYELNNQLTAIPKATTADSFINIDSSQIWYSAEFDPSQIEWEAHSITLVLIEVYTLVDGQQTNNQAFRFHPKDGANSKLYGFLTDAGKTPEYHWSAQYWYAGQDTPNKLEPTKASGRIVILPGNTSAA